MERERRDGGVQLDPEPIGDPGPRRVRPRSPDEQDQRQGQATRGEAISFNWFRRYGEQ